MVLIEIYSQNDLGLTVTSNFSWSEHIASSATVNYSYTNLSQVLCGAYILVEAKPIECFQFRNVPTRHYG